MPDNDGQPTGDGTDTGQQQDGDVTDQSQQNDNSQTGADDNTESQQNDQTKPSDKDKEPDWKAEAEKWKSLARKHETKVKELSPRAAKLQQIEDGQKTESQKLNDQLAAQAVELQALRVEKIRRSAASAAGLDPELAEFITAADEEEATEQAKKLAERLKTNTKSTAPDFKQGTRSTPPPSRSRDELLRGLAGFGAN